jgi:N-methylhydantoinase A
VELTLGIDVGGTFTDLCALGTGGEVRVLKVPSSRPDPVDGILDGIRRLCRDGDRVTRTLLGTTAGLNAVLERRGARTALIATAGFGDVYRMARGDRPEMYNLHYHRPEPLVPREHIFELRERLDADGGVVEALDVEQAAAIARQIAKQRFESVAVCLLHSYRNPEHELAVERALAEHAPEVSRSLSHRVAREWREYERTSTVVVDAYVRPILERHLTRLSRELETDGHSGDVLVMRSSGGLMPASLQLLEPATVLLSGPVGGALATRALARQLDLQSVLAIDMGGTSFDVTLLEGGDLPTGSEVEIDGLPLLVASVPVHTVGAGGGGVVWLEGGGLRVGPRSAGSVPGPICFQQGGEEATVTDANACLGRIGSGSFVDGDLPLDTEAAGAAFAALADRLTMDERRLQQGVIDIVDARMVAAIRVLTVEQGLDVRDFSLVAYGGNGPLHATALADALGIDTVVVPASPGAFSAWGMLFSELRQDLSLTLLRDTGDLRPADLQRPMGELRERAGAFLERAGLSPDAASFRWRADMRYRGQEHSVDVALPPPPLDDGAFADALATFHDLHRRRYGHDHPDEVVEIVTLRLSVLGPTAAPEVAPSPVQTQRADSVRAVTWRGRTREVDIVQRNNLTPGAKRSGPCIVEEQTATTFVPEGWRLRLDAPSAALILTRNGEQA